MTPTLDLPPDVAELARKLAIARAATRHLLAKAEADAKRLDPEPLRALFGTFETMMTNEELDEMRRAD